MSSQGNQEQEQIDFQTQIVSLKKKYYFHELIKHSEKSNHYIVEDLEVEIAQDQDLQENIFFYLKQTFFDSSEELKYAKNYYLNLINYCATPFAKQDIITYTSVWEHSDKNYHELVVVCHFGESDRVDVEQIDKTHINQFMHKLCTILSDMRNYGGLYHGNIFLKNIVLEQDDPKLSGFKPVYLKNKNQKRTWQIEFIEKYDHFKLDMFLLGLLWLKFLNTNIEEYFKEDLNLNQLLLGVQKIKKTLNPEVLQETVANFLNLEIYDEINIDQIILNFNESLLLKMSSESEKKNSQSKNSNLFQQSYKDDVFTLKNPSTNEKSLDPNNLVHLQAGGNFTLRDDQSEDKFEQEEIEMREQVKKMESLKNPKSQNIDLGRLSFDSKKQGNVLQRKIENYYKDEIKEQPQDLEETQKQKSEEFEEDQYLSSKFDDNNEDYEEHQEIQKEIISQQRYGQTKNYEKSEGNYQTENDQDTQEFENLEQMAKNELLSNQNSNKNVQQYVKITQERVKIQMKKQKEQEEKEAAIRKKEKDYKLIFKKKSSQNIEIEKLNQQQEDDEPEYVFGHKIEKPPQQDPELERLVQEEMQRKKEDMERKQREKNEAIKKKYEEQKQKEKEIQERIKRITENKLKKKKQKRQESSDKNKSDISGNSPPKEQRYLDISPSRIQKEKKSQQQVKKQTRVQDVKKPPKVKRQQDQSKSFEEIAQKQKKNYEISGYEDRSKLFEYDSQNYKNKNIPFKNIYKKYKAQYHPETFGQVSNYREVYQGREKSQNKKKNEELEAFEDIRNQNYVQIKTPRETITQEFYTQQSDHEEQDFQEQNIHQENSQQYYEHSQNYQEHQQHQQESSENEYYEDEKVNVNQEQNLDSNDKNTVFQGSRIEKIEPQKPVYVMPPPRENIIDIKEFVEEKIDQKPYHPQYESKPKELTKRKKNYDSKPKDIQTKIPKFNTKNQRENSKQKKAYEIAKKYPSTKKPKQEQNFDSSQKESIQDHLEYQMKISETELVKKETLTDNQDELLDIRNFEKSVQYLNNLKYQKKGLELVEILKTLSILYFKKQDYEKSTLYLREAIDIIKNGKFPDQQLTLNKLKFSLALNYIEAGNYQPAERVLQTIDPENFCPYKFWMVKGDVLNNLGNKEEALQCYMLDFNIDIQKDLTIQENSESFLNILIQIINLFLAFDKTELVKFFNFVLNMLNEILNEKNKNQIESLKVESILIMLNVLLQEKMYDLLNYFLNLIAEEQLLNFDILPDHHFYILAKIYYQFALYLKSIENYGNQKESFLNFLNHSLFLLQQINEKSFQVNNKIVEIYLYKGIFFMQQKAFSTAENNLKSAYDLIVTYLSSKAISVLLFTVLYNLGVTYYNLKNWEESLYYLEQIIQNKCDFENVKMKSLRQLLKLYFKMNLNDRCVEILSPYQEEFFKNVNEETFSYICMYYLCFEKAGQKMKKLEDKIFKEIISNENIQNVHYLGLFTKLQNDRFEHGNFKEVEQLLYVINKILSFDPKKNDVQIFLNQLNLLYAKYMLNKNEEVYDLVQSMLPKLTKNNLVEKNVEQLENFLYNFLLLIMSKIPSDSKTQSYRIAMIDKIKQFKESHKIYDKIYEIINSSSFQNSQKYFSEKSVSSEKFSEQDLLNYQKSFHQKLLKEDKIISQPEPQEPKKKRFVKKKRLKSQEIIKNSNFHKKPHCMCYKYNFQKQEIFNQISQFLNKLVQQEYTYDEVMSQYQNLEKFIKENKLHWEKFIYIKQIFHYFQIHQIQDDETKMYQMIQKVLDGKDICLHDINNILKILECFQESILIEAFVHFLSEKSPSLCKVIFRQLFYDTFYKKYTEMISYIFEVIQKKKYQKIDSYPYMQYLGNQEILKQEKNIKITFNMRQRDLLLSNPALLEIFEHYIDESLLKQFYLDFAIYKALHQILSKKIESSQILTEFMNKLVEIVMEGKLEQITSEFFIYKFLLISVLLEFENITKQELAEQLIQILFFIENKIPQQDHYHYAVTCSWIGNQMNKFELYEQTIKCKSMAFETLKKLEEFKPRFPRWIQEIKPKELMKGILSFMMVNYLKVQKIDFAEKFLEKLLQQKPESNVQQIELYLTGLIFQLESGDLREIDDNLTFCEDRIMNSKIPSLDKKIYDATLQYLKFMKIQINKEYSQSEEQIEYSKQASDNLMKSLQEIQIQLIIIYEFRKCYQSSIIV